VTEPIPIDAADFFEFIGDSGLAVVLVSVHPLHEFNRALSQQLASEHKAIAIGTVDLYDLLATGSSAMRFLHQGLRGCGAPSAFGVLPGYCLFRGGEMLAWDAGLPSFADVEAIARSALLGAIWSGVSRDLAFMRQALQMAADQAAAQRVAAVFRRAIAGEGTKRQAPRESQPPPVDELYWAYQLLGVLPTASDREVHDAWRQKRMETHPDHAGPDAAEFERRSRISREINRARDLIMSHRYGDARGATRARAS
jgi:hypothetical protein